MVVLEVTEGQLKLIAESLKLTYYEYDFEKEEDIEFLRKICEKADVDIEIYR